MNPQELNERIQNVASDAAEYIPIEEPTIGPVLVNMADVEATSVSWLWRHRFAKGDCRFLSVAQDSESPSSRLMRLHESVPDATGLMENPARPDLFC